MGLSPSSALIDGLFRGGKFVPVKGMRRRVMEGRALLDAIRSYGFDVRAAAMPINQEGAYDAAGEPTVQVVAVPTTRQSRARLMRKHDADVCGASRLVRDYDDAEEVLDAINLAARELLGVVRGLG